jgi:DNA modification methylase
MTIPGDNIYEPFAGSGTTIVAAEKTDRNCFAFELDPKYCDVIIERWERLTGQKAELLPAKAD